jgi:hypothetical protein
MFCYQHKNFLKKGLFKSVGKEHIKAKNGKHKISVQGDIFTFSLSFLCCGAGAARSRTILVEQEHQRNAAFRLRL